MRRYQIKITTETERKCKCKCKQKYETTYLQYFLSHLVEGREKEKKREIKYETLNNESEKNAILNGVMILVKLNLTFASYLFEVYLYKYVVIVYSIL